MKYQQYPHKKYPENMKILTEKEKKEIEKKLEEQFGIKKIQGIILQRGTERFFLYNGELSADQISQLEQTIPVERAGVYFAKIFDDKSGKQQIRLSIEGSQLLGNQATKNIFELDKKQTQEWMLGRELLIKTGKKDLFLMKHNNDFLGTGKASEEKISSFVPKNRRLKEKN